jgi:hypothetical protein
LVLARRRADKGGELILRCYMRELWLATPGILQLAHSSGIQKTEGAKSARSNKLEPMAAFHDPRPESRRSAFGQSET